jgi:hypothetical protein
VNGEPRALNRQIVDLWRVHRDDRPVLVIRCGAEQNCEATLGRVWVTREGLLLHYFQHVAPRRMNVDASAVPDEQLREYLDSERSGLKRYEPGSPTGIGTGLRDDDGWLAMLDVDALWHPASVGCSRHDGLIDLDRQQLLDTALTAARTGRPAKLKLTLP